LSRHAVFMEVVPSSEFRVASGCTKPIGLQKRCGWVFDHSRAPGAIDTSPLVNHETHELFTHTKDAKGSKAFDRKIADRKMRHELGKTVEAMKGGSVEAGARRPTTDEYGWTRIF
jgi:hypothetical protein